jgi:SP family myo-inositol transporter-like MFS transporter 13
VLGTLFVTESPRWLYRKGKREQALAALLRSRSQQQAELELHEMEETAHSASQKSAGTKARESLLKRKYVIPFLLACAILTCNTATGVNSVIGYNVGILLQSGLSDLGAHWGYVVLTLVNFLSTLVGMMLVDRKGRRFLFILGTSGIIVSTIVVGTLFLSTERHGVDCASQIQPLVGADQDLTLHFDRAEAQQLLAASGVIGQQIDGNRASLGIIYSYGDFTSTTTFVRSDDPAAPLIGIDRASSIPTSKVEAFFKNPFADFDAARTAPLKIQKAVIGGIPNPAHGWLVALGLYCFMAFYAVGPGVCVWLALSELMPTRIRSNGMSIALVLNQLVSTLLAGIFLPFVSKHGYSSMFFLFAGFTVIYFLVVAFFMPETKGKTLEEIEAHFEGRGAKA